MKARNLCKDLAAILRPVPAGEGDASDAAVERARWEQRQPAENLWSAWEEGSVDPLLSQVRKARQRRLQAEQDLRSLIAYAREFMHPRPYRLIDMAEAAGLSVSGVRINYDGDDVKLVAELLRGASHASEDVRQGEGGLDGDS
jgi:hypothetical protein